MFIPKLFSPGYAAVQLSLGRIEPPWAAVLLQSLFFAALSTAVGFLFTRLIEDPFLRLRERVLPRQTVSVETRG
jgi:peptidoglycan/LPS O-acetylase OafA/YrhL